jgi:hypothetical protein
LSNWREFPRSDRLGLVPVWYWYRRNARPILAHVRASAGDPAQESMHFEWVARRVLGNVPSSSSGTSHGYRSSRLRRDSGPRRVRDAPRDVDRGSRTQVYYPAAHLTGSRLPLSHIPDVCTAQRAMTKDRTEWPKDTLRHVFSSHLRLSSCDSSGRLKIDRFRARRRLIRGLIADTGRSNLSGPVRRAPRSGRGGRRFKSCHSDQKSPTESAKAEPGSKRRNRAGTDIGTDPQGGAAGICQGEASRCIPHEEALYDQSSHRLASNAHTLPIRTTVDAKQQSALPRGERHASRCRALGHSRYPSFRSPSAPPP